MYTRSYKTDVTATEKIEFMYKVLSEVVKGRYYMHKNDYPYDSYADSQDPVTIKDHITIRYNPEHAGMMEDIEVEIQPYLEQGYVKQINDAENKSIKDIEHMHLVFEE